MSMDLNKIGYINIKKRYSFVAAIVVLAGMFWNCPAYPYDAAQEAATGPVANAPAGEIRVHRMEPVKPYEFNEDLRNLSYSPYRGPDLEMPYRPILRPPIRPKLPLPSYVPEFPSSYGPLLPMPGPVQNFSGISFGDTCTGGRCGGGWPPDPNGDVGPNHYIQAVNTAYAVYDKATGNLLAAFTENNLWAGAAGAGPCDGHSDGDPVVLYDPMADRWIITHFAFANNSTPFYQCIAVSKTGDPVSGGWWFYALRMDPGDAGHPPVGALNDYAKFGIWPDCVYMSANEFLAPGFTFAGTLVAAFSRSDLESGLPLNWSMEFLDATIPANNMFTMIPSNVLGASPSSLPPAGTPNYFVSESQAAFNFEVRTFSATNNCSGGTFNTIPVLVSQTGYDSANLADVVPQSGAPNNLLDAIDDRLMQKVRYRRIGASESLWVVHNIRTISPTSTVVPQWAQLNVTGGTIANTPMQQQIYAPDTSLYRWMGSLAVDKDGNMALGYSTSSASTFPSIAYSGRLAGDPLNSLPQTETVLITGAGSQTNNCGGSPCHRWGDYSAMSVDPSDDCTFWYTNEYYSSPTNGTGGNWQTRIGSFRFSTCNPNFLVKKVSNGSSFSGIGAAYGTITGSDTLDVQSITFYESLVLDKSFLVTLSGGWDSSFLSNSGFSAIHGSFTITGGPVIIDKVSVQ